MKKLGLLILITLLFAVLLFGCAEKEELGAWEMPAVDAKPTLPPTPAPSYSPSAPEVYNWNQAELFDMALPGAPAVSIQETMGHGDTMKLFPYNFLPAELFGESHSAYKKLRLQKTEHDVLLQPESRELAGFSYVEFKYMPSGKKDADSISVMAELCDYDTVLKISRQRDYPHLVYAEGASPQLSSYYLENFVLAEYEGRYVAQILKLPMKSYLDEARRLSEEAAAKGVPYTPARQILLTISCGENVSREEFIAVVCTLLRYSDGSELPPVDDGLPKPGEKGAA